MPAARRVIICILLRSSVDMWCQTTERIFSLEKSIFHSQPAVAVLLVSSREISHENLSLFALLSRGETALVIRDGRMSQFYFFLMMMKAKELRQIIEHRGVVDDEDETLLKFTNLILKKIVPSVDCYH